ncbi:MAG: DUF305 domain-containing protein [Chloroflexota bacterium]|nr:DUF305 domain-containing protein [Chloroflexota bacterium]
MQLTWNLRNILPKRGVLAFVAASLIAVGMAPLSTWAMPQAQTADDLSHLKGLTGKAFETEFMSEMIQHHQSALDMAKLVPDRANHQEVKDAAQKIIASQTPEISEMTSWLKQWYSATPQQGMMHDMPGMSMSDMTQLQGLKGDAFDKQFLTMMRMHHQGAVAMAQLIPGRATHEELKTLGTNIVSSQSAEITQFEGWLKAWYALDVTGTMMGGTMSATATGGMSGMGGAMGGASATSMPATSATGTGGASTMPGTGAGDGGRGIWLLLLGVLGLSTALLAGGIRLRKRT